MRYIKLFEELNPNTYRHAANALDKLGHKRRAEDLRSWAIKESERRNFRKWSPFGQYKMDVLRPKWIRATQNAGVASGGYYTYEKIMSGNFYLGVSLDEDGGNVSDWYDGHGALSLNFYLGFMPADDMTIKDIKNTPGIQSNMWNGMTWDTNFYIPFTNKNSKEILKTPTIQFESMDQYLVICSDRKNAIKLRKLIIDIFMEKIVIGDSAIQKLKELLLDVTGSNETFSQIQESVKNISINSFFHD